MNLDTILQKEILDINSPNKQPSFNKISSPSGYKGLAAFHKYWGKKPVECLAYLIESLTLKGEIIVDPFVGSGLIGREAILRERQFIGIDINPIAVEMSRFLVDIPNRESLIIALENIEKNVKYKIEETYKMVDGKIATHYLWNEETLKSVWYVRKGKGGREERLPTQFDIDLYNQYKNYVSQIPRPLKLFQNSRINTTNSLSLNDIFTGRSLYNIDLILEAIYSQPDHIRRALLLSLTSASGQMSRMVFAITGRGKTNGTVSKKVEVGSWVIGYWRPNLHFEINVWNCFYKRAAGLIKAISKQDINEKISILGEVDSVLAGAAAAAIVNGDARYILDSLPSDSVSLIVTDPPHSDRIPYLELSDMWNSLLGIKVNFEREIVVSNAQGRQKTKEVFSKEMAIFIKSATRVLKPGRFLALLFNARDEKSWEFLRKLVSGSKNLSYCGYFPMSYSANSVVQDNRKGSLKNDFVLIYQKKGEGVILEETGWLSKLECIAGWSINFPGK